MTEALSEADLAAIIERDAATGDGLAEPDYRCAEDRHVLLVELNRLRSDERKPTNEGAPWQSG